MDGGGAIIRIQNFPIGLHVMYLYFPDTPRTFVGLPEDGISAPTHVAVDMMYYMVQMLDDILTARNVSAYTAGS